MRQNEYKAFFDIYVSKFSDQASQPTLHDQCIFEEALRFASKHGYVTPRERCPVLISVDQVRINAIMCMPNLSRSRVAQCELDVNHAGHCHVTP